MKELIYSLSFAICLSGCKTTNQDWKTVWSRPNSTIHERAQAAKHLIQTDISISQVKETLGPFCAWVPMNDTDWGMPTTNAHVHPPGEYVLKTDPEDPATLSWVFEPSRIKHTWFGIYKFKDGQIMLSFNSYGDNPDYSNDKYNCMFKLPTGEQTAEQKFEHVP